MKKRIIGLLLSAIIIGGLGFNTTASAATNGWALNADYKWSYYDNGQRVTGWIRPDGYNWYYLNSNGDMLTGFQKIDGKWYLLDQSEGSMEFDNTVGPYYFDNDGTLKKIKSGTLMPDEAYNKLKTAMLNKHKNYKEDEIYISNLVFDRSTGTMSLIMCGYIDDFQTQTGKALSEGVIDPATGKVKIYY